MKRDNTIYKSVLMIGDLHCPYIHPDAIDFLAYLKDTYQPDLVIQMGDEVDNHAISFHDSDPDLPNAGKELELAIKALEPLYKLFPKVTLLESNHGSLVLRKALVHGIPQAMIKSYNDILDAPIGWSWVPDVVINTEIGQIYACHGKTSVFGKLARQYGMSTVQGHFHSNAGIVYISNPNHLLFDMFTGCLIDDKSRAMRYNKLDVSRPIISSSVILNGIPEVIPMILDKKGRWVGPK